MACSSGDMDDFVTCGVCLMEYDTEEKKPKFLHCFHTLCHQCAKKICRDGSISCPFCRRKAFIKDVSAMANNSYALHMVQLLQQDQKKLEEAKKAIFNPLVVGWCFTCNETEKPNCAQLAHSSAKMSAESIRNLDALLSLKEELLKMKDKRTENLAKAIEKRVRVQEKLSVIMNSIKTAENNVKQLQEENNLRLTEMISTLEQINDRNLKPDGAKMEDEKKDDLDLSELMNLIDVSSPEKDREMVRLKMLLSVELSEEKLEKATALASEYDLQETMKTVIQLFDDKDCPIATGKWLKNGFRLQPDNQPLMSSEIRQELLLINHLITSFLRRQNVTLESKQSATSMAVVATTSTSPTQDPLHSLLRIRPLPDLRRSPIFILRLYPPNSNKEIGKLYIQSVPTFHPEFIEKLSEFCKSSKQFHHRGYNEAVTNVFESYAMSNQQFQPNVPSMLAVNRSAVRAERVDEVGVLSIKNSDGPNPVVVGWSFIFPLKNFQSPKFQLQTKPRKVNELFGRVIQHQMMRDFTFKLSLLSRYERKKVTVTLESV